MFFWSELGFEDAHWGSDGNQTMTLGWIAQTLHMRAKTHLSHLLSWHGKEKKTGHAT
jgi:hypothetical protein